MFDSLKITTSYLSFYCFLVFQTVLKNVKNFRESYVFHCLVIKVVCLRLSADNSFIISLAFCFVKNFFILFFKFFFHLHQQLWYNIMSSVSCQHFFYIFFQLYSTKSLLSVKKNPPHSEADLSYHYFLFASSIILHFFTYFLHYLRYRYNILIFNAPISE